MLPGLGLCECGCGSKVNRGKRFIRGHNRLGKRSTQVKVKLEIIPTPCLCGCGGLTTIYRGKSRIFLPGHQARGEHNSRFGVHLSEETKKKVKEGNLLAVKEGRNHTAKSGWKHTEGTRLKLSVARKARVMPPPRRIARNCATCGKVYYRPPSVTQTNYCSLHCSGVGTCTGSKKIHSTGSIIP